jgi:hypothetical protein
MKYCNNRLVVDVSDLPKNIQNMLYEEAKNRMCIGQNKYFTYYIHDLQKPRNEYKGNEILFVDKSIGYIIERGDNIISDWFYDNEDLKNREQILILINW